jgi:hypothetical protein
MFGFVGGNQWNGARRPLQRFLIFQRPLSDSRRAHSAAIGRTKHEEARAIREKSEKFVD